MEKNGRHRRMRHVAVMSAAVMAAGILLSGPVTVQARGRGPSGIDIYDYPGFKGAGPGEDTVSSWNYESDDPWGRLTKEAPMTGDGDIRRTAGGIGMTTEAGRPTAGSVLTADGIILTREAI